MEFVEARVYWSNNQQTRYAFDKLFAYSKLLCPKVRAMKCVYAFYDKNVYATEIMQCVREYGCVRAYVLFLNTFAHVCSVFSECDVYEEKSIR